MNVKNPLAGFSREASAVTTGRYKNGEMSVGTTEAAEKRNTTADYVKSELAVDRTRLDSAINSHPGESVSPRAKDGGEPEKRARTNFKKLPKNDGILGHWDHYFKELLARQSSRDNSEKSNEDGEGNDERIVTANSLTRKSEEVKDDKGERDVTGEPLNHGGSFHLGRWGMSVLSPPAGFLRDVYQISQERSIHRKNKERRTGAGGDKSDYPAGRWGMSVSSPPKKFFEDILMRLEHRGTGPTTVKTRSGPSEGRSSVDDRSPAPQSRENLQTDSGERVMSDRRRNETFARTSVGKVPNNLRNNDRQFDARSNSPANVDFSNKLFSGNVRLLMRDLQINVDFGPNVTDNINILLRTNCDCSES